MARISALILAFRLFFTLASAQSYRCDWQVVAIGGNEMAGAYRTGSTAGQTAIGWLNSTNLMAHIGFWYPDIVTGIAEKENFRWESASSKETRLFPPAPNPFIRTTQLRYTLNTERQTRIQICDISGRTVRTLLNSSQPAGRYTLVWDGKDNSGRPVASGIYICRFTAGDYQHSTKLILQR